MAGDEVEWSNVFKDLREKILLNLELGNQINY